MRKLLTYIFNHKYYKEVLANYEIATSTYKYACNIWLKYHPCYEKSNFELKEYISENISEIKLLAKWIKSYDKIRVAHHDGLVWFFSEIGYMGYPQMSFLEYKQVAANLSEIKKLQDYSDKYTFLVSKHREAVDRFLNTSQQYHSYKEIKTIAVNYEEIKKYSAILKICHQCENKYKDAWNLFSNGRSFSKIPLEELAICKIEHFKIKNCFLQLYAKNDLLIKLILGQDLLSINSFTETNFVQEQDIISYFQSSLYIEFNNILRSASDFYGKVRLGDCNEHKRAVLDSVDYGNKCNFVASFSISDFYEMRKKYEQDHIAFDDAVRKKDKYINIIKVFNKKNSNKEEVYIEDYLGCMLPHSKLYNFIKNYEEQKEKRDKVKLIQQNYRKGFEYYFNSVDADTIPFSDVLKIQEKENDIIIKHRELEEQDKKQRIIEHLKAVEERKKREQERKLDEISGLKNKVSSWPKPSLSSVRCFSLYYYYPTTCEWNASEDEWEIRKLIWDFKANPNRPQSIIEITSRHQRAMNEVVPELKRVLSNFLGNNVSKLTLVCIPSSKRVVTERRYKDFSSLICSETGMTNGYSHVHVAEEGEAAHLGGRVQAQYSVDSSFFNGRYVILFDDVITSGRSMERFKRLLESAGANIIAGLSIGKTKHERQWANPIDSI